MASQIIAIEEHFTSPALRDAVAPRPGPIQTMLDDMTGRRIKDMDEGGIDIAVLSENNPAAHNLPPDKSVALAKASNDFLHEQIKANPTRFKGFAALPLPARTTLLDRLVDAQAWEQHVAEHYPDAVYIPTSSTAAAARSSPPGSRRGRGGGAGGCRSSPWTCRVSSGPRSARHYRGRRSAWTTGTWCGWPTRWSPR